MKKIIFISILFFILFSNNSYCQDGSLDLTFSGDGKLTSGIGYSYDNASSIALQNDGKIIVAGLTQIGSQYGFAVMRYNIDGDLDISFDGDGKVTTPIGISNDSGVSVVIQTDGKIVLAGSEYNGTNYDIAVARYHSNGSLDTSFDIDGKTTIAIGTQDDYGACLVLQTDGKIIVCGKSRVSIFSDFCLIRLDSNGSLDTTFDTDGKVTTSFGTSATANAASVIVQTDGKIIASGSSGSGGSYNFAVARYNSDGSLDTTFDTDGKLTTDFNLTDNYSYCATLQSDGKFVVAGSSDNGSGRNLFALSRYNNNGSLDTTFDSDGKVTTSIGGIDDFIYSIKIQSDGKIVAVGSSKNSNNYDFAVARYNTNGSLDTTFDTDGKVITPIGLANDFGKATVISTNGKILVAGQVYNESYDFTLVRYNSNGSLDTGLDTDGKTITNFGNANSICYSIALQTDGKMIMAGASYNGTQTEYSLIRHNSDGSIDTSFDTDGKVVTPIGLTSDIGSSIAIQNDGKIVLAGDSYNGTNYDYEFAIVRYNSNGSLDTSFDTDGKVTTAIGGFLNQISSIAIQPDGKIIVAGVSSTNKTNSNYNFALARYNSNGTLDTSFDGDGKVTTAIGDSNKAVINSIALQSDGKIVAVGNCRNGMKFDFAVARYNSNGSLDTTFDTDGKLTTAIGPSTDFSYSVAIQNDGKFVVAGSSTNGSSTSFALVRYNIDGSLDTSFDNDGKVTTAIGGIDDIIYSIKIQSDGKIVAAGSSTDGSNFDYALSRYTTNGSLDTTFDIDGKLTTNVGVTASQDTGYSLVLQPDGKIVVGGTSFNGNNYEFSLVRYNSSFLDIEEVTAQKNSILVYPNPFSDTITVTSNSNLNEASCTLYNNFGQILKQINNVSGNDFNLNLDSITSGIYFLTLENKNVKTTKKIIKK